MLSFSTSQEKKDTAYLEIYYIGIMFTQDQREVFFFSSPSSYPLCIVFNNSYLQVCPVYEYLNNMHLNKWVKYALYKDNL